MKKLIATMILALVALVLSTARATGEGWEAEQQAAERQAFADWVLTNAQEPLAPEQVYQIVDQTVWQAQQQQLEPSLVLAVMRVESGFRPKAHGRGSKGLMQVQVYWHRDKLKGRSPFDPLVSIEVGTRILGDCWRKYPTDLPRTLRCYNGGGDRAYASKVTTQQRAVSRAAHQSVFERFLARLDAPAAQ